MGLELLFLLLPIAALSGWWTGRRSVPKADSQDYPLFSADYFKGLNYLLNEQPDKAIDVFVRMLDVDGNTIDIHFALGNLFRRRGEVDRATRIHQNLIARPTLSREQRNKVLFELGRDYFSAGLLDRAESLFLELVDDEAHGKKALAQLLDIYQQERDWDKAIQSAKRLNSMAGTPMHQVIAQFYCEQAEAALQRGEQGLGARLIRRALAEDRHCVRATLLQARQEMASGSYRGAIRTLKKVEQQDPNFLPEVVVPLQECFAAIGRPMDMLGYLEQLYTVHGGISLMLAQAELLRRQQGEEQALAFVVEQLGQRPSVRGMQRLIDLKLRQNRGSAQDDLSLLGELTTKLLEGKPIYKCETCGFHGKTLHWQCPSCKRWNSVKPIQGIEGE